MRSTALYPASTGPCPTEHAMCSSPSASISLTVAVERPSVPQVTYAWSSFQLNIGSNWELKKMELWTTKIVTKTKIQTYLQITKLPYNFRLKNFIRHQCYQVCISNSLEHEQFNKSQHKHLNKTLKKTSSLGFAF